MGKQNYVYLSSASPIAAPFSKLVPSEHPALCHASHGAQEVEATLSRALEVSFCPSPSPHSVSMVGFSRASSLCLVMMQVSQTNFRFPHMSPKSTTVYSKS
jgi:hypothetical protein